MQQQSSSRMPSFGRGHRSSSVSRLNDRSRALRKEIARTNPDKDLRPRLEEYHPGAEHGEGPKSYFATLRNDWNRRQAAYEAREAEYHARVLQLEEEIEQARAAGAQAPAADPRVVDRAFLELHDMHETVVSNLERSEDRTTKILREQERSLMRAFRARVHDRTRARRRARREGGGRRVWKQLAQALDQELSWARVIGNRLQGVNDELAGQNAMVKRQFSEGEEDRALLIRQLVAVKKDSAELKQAIAERLRGVHEARAELAKLKRSASFGFGSSVNNDPKEVRAAKFDEARPKRLDDVKHLRRLLEQQQRNVRQVRLACSEDVEESTAIQRMLRTCVRPPPPPSALLPPLPPPSPSPPFARNISLSESEHLPPSPFPLQVPHRAPRAWSSRPPTAAPARRAPAATARAARRRGQRRRRRRRRADDVAAARDRPAVRARVPGGADRRARARPGEKGVKRSRRRPPPPARRGRGRREPGGGGRRRARARAAAAVWFEPRRKPRHLVMPSCAQARLHKGTTRRPRRLRLDSTAVSARPAAARRAPRRRRRHSPRRAGRRARSRTG